MSTTSNQIQDEREGLPSASFYPIGVNCHGAWHLSRLVPEPKKDGATTSGTDIHEALETGDDSRLSIADMTVAERIRDIEGPELLKFAEANGIGGFVNKFEVIRERRFWINHDLVKSVSAKLDVVYRLGKYAFAINYKTGYKRVKSAKENWQIMVEAACYLAENPKVTVMRIGFISARFKSQIEWVDLVNIERYQLVHAVLAESAKWTPEAERTPGEWCRWCPAKGWCDEALAVAEAPTLQVEPSIAKSKKDQALEMVSRMTEAQMAAVIRKSGLITAIVEAAKDRAMAMSPEDLKRVGLQRVKGRRWSKFKDYGMAVRRIELKGLMNEDQVNEASDISIGAVVEAVAKGYEISESKAKVMVREKLEPVIESGQHAETVGAQEE